MPDGTSNTVLFGERYQVCDFPAHGNEALAGWAAYWETYPTITHGSMSFDYSAPVFNGPSSGGTTFGGKSYRVDNGGNPGIAETAVAGISTPPGGNNSGYNPTLPFQLTPSVTTCDYSILQSPHTGVLLVALGDGSVRNVSGSISLTTWAEACNPSDGNPLGSDW